MKKLKEVSRRALCVLLVSVSLSMTVASDYYGARYCQAVATATALEAFIEAIIAACGYSCRSRQDLTNTTSGFEYVYNYYKENGLFEGTKYATLATYPLTAVKDSFKIGEKIVFDTPVKQAVRDFATDYVRKCVSSSRGQFGKTTVPDVSDTSYKLQVQFGQITETQLRSMWNNIPVGSINGLALSKGVVNNGILLVAKKIDWSTGKMFFKIVYTKSAVTKPDFQYYAQYNDTFSFCNKNGGSLVDGQSLNTYCISLTKEAADSKYLSCDNSETVYVDEEDGTRTKTLIGTRYSKAFDTWIDEFAGNDYSICVYSSLPVYDSYQDYVTTNTAASTFPTAGYVGDGSTTKDISESMDISNGDLTSTIEDAINNAMENNPSLTQEEIDAIVNSIISEISGVEDSIEDGTEAQTTANTWLSKIHSIVSNKFDISLSSIASNITAFNSNVKTKFDSLSSTVTSGLDEVVSAVQGLDFTVDLSGILSRQAASNTFLSSLVDGTSALKEDTDDIAEQFTVIEGGGGEQEPEEEPDDSVGVWIPVIPTVIAFLRPLLEFLGTPLSIVTKHLNTLKNTLEDIHVGWQEWIKGTFDNSTGIFTKQLPQILTQLQAIAQSVAAYPAGLPAAIASAIAEVLPDVLPDIEFAPIPLELPEAWPEGWPEPEPVSITLPEPINYLDILQQILSAIQSIFSLDVPAVDEAVDDLDTAVDDVVPDLPDFPALFDLNFTDEINYPVFKMKTPDILKSAGIKDDYIILLNTQEYVTYIIWVRRLIRCIVWLTFAYAVLCHFKVDLNVE